MTITTRLYTALFGQLVGRDALGNCYYERRTRSGAERWAVYAHGRDPSVVSPEWHGWLHHTVSAPPTASRRVRYSWEKPAQANLTGTAGAYLPKGHLLKGGVHAPTIAAYEPWQPR